MMVFAIYGRFWQKDAILSIAVTRGNSETERNRQGTRDMNWTIDTGPILPQLPTLEDQPALELDGGEE